MNEGLPQMHYLYVAGLVAEVLASALRYIWFTSSSSSSVKPGRALVTQLKGHRRVLKEEAWVIFVFIIEPFETNSHFE